MVDVRAREGQEGKEAEIASINKSFTKLVEVQEREGELVGSSVYFKMEDKECLDSAYKDPIERKKAKNTREKLLGEKRS